mmetsp:Transcript_120039/g.239008  ORF Transcript_120039/g.239008 Transcript_120039/m.239008 type:complete len:199 (-) Transcript_120039:17-613(-)|eukprot:CAMPEP_0172748184 /NCGR_PEP_ID=MMETSP1074-20121228/144507_1 /TAXON_ID=2916 /ORGANISM="Ceratium fusus, Strain PA161109" /LENGTH=198 /DNA_ID=CAMNT_0013579889 /DNA_START=16 /DNA_END=612 /DNA_ORIENTATION=+
MTWSMQVVLLCGPLIIAEAGLWSGASGFLSMRIPDTYDLDLRKVVKRDLQAVAKVGNQEVAHALNGPSKAAASIAKASASASENSSTKPINRSVTKGHSEQKRQRTQRNAEASLIDSLRHVGEKGDDAVVCVTTCRYGEAVRHEWQECLDRCVENPLMRSTFFSMLPEEHHKAHSSNVKMPQILLKTLEHKRQRSSEL